MSAQPKNDPPPQCPGRETLSLFLFGRLENDRLEAVGAHLADCPVCQEHIGQLDSELRKSDGNVLQRTLPHPDSHTGEVSNFQRLRGKLLDLQQDSSESDAPGATTIPTPNFESSLPKQIGQYQLQECLGRGAMGIVFKAWHVKLKRPMAIKLLLPRHHGDTQFLQRFECEMEAVGKLGEHPHIVRANDASEENGLPYLVMEYVEGCDLSTLLARMGRIRVADACEMARQAALGLDHAHRHGVLHRDVKPSNLLLSTQGQVKVMDLGLAIFQEDLASPKPFFSSESLVGTADYLAPELWSGATEIGVESDVYSLGCTLFKLLVGHAPYSDRDAKSKKKAHLAAPLPSVSGESPTIPAELDALVRRMLAKKPGDRFRRIAEVAVALEPFAAGAKLKELAQKAHGEHSDTQPMAGDRTRLTQIVHSLKWQVSRRMPRPIFLLLLLLLPVVLAASVWWSLRGPEGPKVLIAGDAGDFFWNYDPSKTLLHIESPHTSLISVGSTTRDRGVLETCIIPVMGQPAAGVFYQYQEHWAHGTWIQRVEMLGIRPQASGTGHEIYQGTGTKTDLNNGYLSWTFEEHAQGKFKMDEKRKRVDLKLNFVEGKLQSVWCDDKQIRLDGQADPGPDQTGKPIGLYGVFNQEGTTNFWRTRFLE